MKAFLRKHFYWIYVILQKLFDEIRYYYNIIQYKKIKDNFKYEIKDEIDTINEIIREKKSLSRYGDGEFKWMLKIKQYNFQDDNEELSKRLLEVLTSNEDRLLIGIPKAFFGISEYNHNAKKYWMNFICKYHTSIKQILTEKKEYHNASITRPYIDYKDKSKCFEKFNNLKKLWDNRDVIIIEGEKSKLGLGNDLFDNTKSIERIICPSKNAFDKYNEILEFTLSLPKDKLYLISLGPSATVLSYDLCVNGYQALDIGHIDIEYEWFKSKSKTKKRIKGKNTNESLVKRNTKDIYMTDEKYNKEIIRRIV